MHLFRFIRQSQSASFAKLQGVPPRVRAPHSSSFDNRPIDFDLTYIYPLVQLLFIPKTNPNPFQFTQQPKTIPSPPTHTNMTAPRSHIECLGEERTRCGYCRTRYTSRNFGVWAHTLDVRDYQALLDAGWRRSGAYLYRPDLQTTCCPCFVIRLDAARYTPSVTHKRVLKRLRRFAAAPSLSPTTSSVSAADPLANSTKSVLPPGANVADDDKQLGQLRSAVESALAGALNDILQHPHDADLFPSRDVVDRVRPTIKLFPPRASAKVKRNSHPASHPGSQAGPASNSRPKSGGKGNAAPILVCNVAMLLAATERKAKAEAASGSGSAATTSDRKDGSGKKNSPAAAEAKKEQLRMQMDLANVIARHLTDHSSDLGIVTVTEPGFLNFWRSDEMEDIEDSDVMHESATTEKQANVENVYASCLSQRLRSQARQKPIEFPQSLVADMIPLSRVGSDVSSERTGGVSDYPSPAPDTARRRMAREPVRVRHGSHRIAIAEEVSGGKSFTMDFVPSQFRPEAFEIFRKYQMAVHREPAEQCTEDTYRRFLVDTPLVQAPSPLDPEQWYGSFHIMYRIRGRLFAVGVVDILPRCLSSVYLFYDPDFAKLSPGTLSALNEIEWVKRASNAFPSLQFYYMGYYIHSCPKMRYKAAYHPSEILCEVTKNWIPAKDVKELLGHSHGRQLRLAPLTMLPAPEYENFRIDSIELENLTDHAKLRVDFGHGPEGIRLITFGELCQILPFEYRRHIEVVRSKVRRFIALTGRRSSYFMYDVP